MSHPGRTFNRTQLLAQVWGDDNEVDERTVDVNVQRLRQILAEPGYGPTSRPCADSAIASRQPVART